MQPDITSKLGITRDEKELRLIKLRKAVKQQRELHAIKLKIADTELKLTLVKLSLAEENVQLQSVETVIN